LTHQEVAVKIRLQDPPPLLIRKIEEANAALHARVVDEDVDATQFRDDALAASPDLLWIPGIDLYGDSPNAVLTRLSSRGLSGIRSLAVDHCDIRATLRQPQYDGSTNAPAAARHHRSPTLKIHLHAEPLPVFSTLSLDV
jgi:hypothetical protein